MRKIEVLWLRVVNQSMLHGEFLVRREHAVVIDGVSMNFSLECTSTVVSD
jgi:hypothetical protein